jgi:hypothetical protein
MAHERQTSSSIIVAIVLVMIVLLALVAVVICGGVGVFFLRASRVAPPGMPGQPMVAPQKSMLKHFVDETIGAPPALPPQMPADTESDDVESAEDESQSNAEPESPAP